MLHFIVSPTLFIFIDFQFGRRQCSAINLFMDHCALELGKKFPRVEPVYLKQNRSFTLMKRGKLFSINIPVCSPFSVV